MNKVIEASKHAEVKTKLRRTRWMLEMEPQEGRETFATIPAHQQEYVYYASQVIRARKMLEVAETEKMLLQAMGYHYANYDFSDINNLIIERENELHEYETRLAKIQAAHVGLIPENALLV